MVLASASPRRLGLLRSVGLDPRVAAQDVDETPQTGEAPIAYALRVARMKARAGALQENGAVLAADTTVALDGAILGKARDAAEARDTLRRLSGRTHTVHTAVVLILRGTPEERVLEQVVSTAVRFRALSDDEIARYVETGEPVDKAGSYGIQGAGGALVAALSGSYTNVVGLPLEETLALLRLAGVLA